MSLFASCNQNDNNESSKTEDTIKTDTTHFTQDTVHIDTIVSNEIEEHNLELLLGNLDTIYSIKNEWNSNTQLTSRKNYR